MFTLILIGELDRSSTIELETAIEGLCEREVAGITLDLSKLTRIDATAVAVIVFRCHWCRQRGYEFALVPGAADVQRTFEQAGALEQLPFIEQAPPSEEDSHTAILHA